MSRSGAGSGFSLAHSPSFAKPETVTLEITGPEWLCSQWSGNEILYGNIVFDEKKRRYDSDDGTIELSVIGYAIKSYRRSRESFVEIHKLQLFVFLVISVLFFYIYDLYIL